MGPCALFVPRSKQLFLKVVSFEERNNVEGRKRNPFLLAVPDVTFDSNNPLRRKVVSWIVFSPGDYQTQICKSAELSKHDKHTGVIDFLFPELLAASNTTAFIENGIWDGNTFGIPEPGLPPCWCLGFRRIWRRLLWNSKLRSVVLRPLETRQTSQYISSCFSKLDRKSVV